MGGERKWWFARLHAHSMPGLGSRAGNHTASSRGRAVDPLRKFKLRDYPARASRFWSAPREKKPRENVATRLKNKCNSSRAMRGRPFLRRLQNGKEKSLRQF